MAGDLQEITEGRTEDFFKSFAEAFLNMPGDLLARGGPKVRNPNNVAYAGESVGYAVAIAFLFGVGLESFKYFSS